MYGGSFPSFPSVAIQRNVKFSGKYDMARRAEPTTLTPHESLYRGMSRFGVASLMLYSKAFSKNATKSSGNSSKCLVRNAESAMAMILPRAT